VNAASVIFTAITVQDGATSPPKTKYTLQEKGKAAYVAGTDKMQVVVTLDAKDLQQLQLKRTTLFADRATTFVLIAGGGVEDTTGLKLASMKAALQTETFGNRDIVGLRSFDLNMSSAQLTLQFKGAVDAKSFEPDQLTLRSATATGAGTQTVALTASSTTSSANAMKIVVDIGDSDMDRIKAMRKLATRKNDTCVEMTAKVFVDLFGTRISSLVPNDGVIVNDFTADTVAPVLKAFDLNVDQGTIRLNFTETVDLNTFTAKGLALTTLGNSINLTLSGGTIVEKAIEKKDSSTVFTIAMDKARPGRAQTQSQAGDDHRGHLCSCPFVSCFRHELEPRGTSHGPAGGRGGKRRNGSRI